LNLENTAGRERRRLAGIMRAKGITGPAGRRRSRPLSMNESAIALIVGNVYTFPRLHGRSPFRRAKGPFRCAHGGGNRPSWLMRIHTHCFSETSFPPQFTEKTRKFSPKLKTSTARQCCCPTVPL
jgi:hypothetical protein